MLLVCTNKHYRLFDQNGFVMETNNDNIFEFCDIINRTFTDADEDDIQVEEI